MKLSCPVSVKRTKKRFLNYVIVLRYMFLLLVFIWPEKPLYCYTVLTGTSNSIVFSFSPLYLLD